MSWVLLMIAGLFETSWTVGIKYTDGFTRPLPSLLTALAFLISMGLLGLATRELPISTAYAVWVGIATVGAAVLGVILFGEPMSALRIFFLALLLVAIIGLKVTSNV